MIGTTYDLTLETATGTRMPELVGSTRVLLVDDDPMFLNRAQYVLAPDNEVRAVQNGSDAFQTVRAWSPDVVLFDLLLEDLDGFTFMEQVAGITIAHRPFILYTTDGRGAGTRVRPLPNWHVGTLIRSAPAHQLRAAVLQAARCQQNQAYQRQIIA